MDKEVKAYFDGFVLMGLQLNPLLTPDKNIPAIKLAIRQFAAYFFKNLPEVFCWFCVFSCALCSLCVLSCSACLCFVSYIFVFVSPFRSLCTVFARGYQAIVCGKSDRSKQQNQRPARYGGIR
jgi:hypothetical protein